MWCNPDKSCSNLTNLCTCILNWLQLGKTWPVEMNVHFTVMIAILLVSNLFAALEFSAEVCIISITLTSTHYQAHKNSLHICDYHLTIRGGKIFHLFLVFSLWWNYRIYTFLHSESCLAWLVNTAILLEVCVAPVMIWTWNTIVFHCKWNSSFN